jgi:hypothetical protein
MMVRVGRRLFDEFIESLLDFEEPITQIAEHIAFWVRKFFDAA